jgi:Ni/Fe-hydrogenase 1 B-type cytochrome subunit
MAKRTDIAVPRRIYHWINLISVIALIYTGYNIANPRSGVAMGTMREIHFVFMWVFGANVLLRIYWAFFGRSGDWRKYLAQRWTDGEVWGATIRHYLKFERFPKGMEDRLVQNTTYAIIAVLFLFQLATGLMLYLPLNTMMQTFTSILGGLQSVRYIHLFTMWIFMAFIVIHIYMSVSEEFDKIKLMLFSVADEKE